MRIMICLHFLIFINLNLMKNVVIKVLNHLGSASMKAIIFFFLCETKPNGFELFILFFRLFFIIIKEIIIKVQLDKVILIPIDERLDIIVFMMGGFLNHFKKKKKIKYLFLEKEETR